LFWGGAHGGVKRLLGGTQRRGTRGGGALGPQNSGPQTPPAEKGGNQGGAVLGISISRTDIFPAGPREGCCPRGPPGTALARGRGGPEIIVQRFGTPFPLIFPAFQARPRRTRVPARLPFLAKKIFFLGMAPRLQGAGGGIAHWRQFDRAEPLSRAGGKRGVCLVGRGFAKWAGRRTWFGVSRGVWVGHFQGPFVPRTALATFFPPEFLPVGRKGPNSLMAQGGELRFFLARFWGRSVGLPGNKKGGGDMLAFPLEIKGAIFGRGRSFFFRFGRLKRETKRLHLRAERLAPGVSWGPVGGPFFCLPP